MKPTKYEDVNEVLDLLTSNLQKILGKKLVAFYLTGSLTYSDFDYGSSDIDFLVVLTSELTITEIEGIKIMHRMIAKKVPYWEKRLEGSYIPRLWLGRINRPRNKRAYVNAGTVAMLPYGNEWLLNLHALYDYGIPFIGESPKKLIKPIDINDVKKASRKNLFEEWLPKLKEENPFTNPNYDSSHLQAYAILTMCRILYLTCNNKSASKKVAAEWTRKTYKPWSNLIESAESWHHGIKLNKHKEIKEFIKFVADTVKNDSKTGNSHKTYI